MSKPKAKAAKSRPRPRPASAGTTKTAGVTTGKRPGAGANGSGRAAGTPTRRRAAKARRRQIRNRAAGAGVVLLGVGLLAFAAISARQRHARVVRQLTAGGCTLDSTTDPGGEHIAAPTYRIDPPSGGDHLPSAARAGFYEPGSEAPADGAAVHSLQHGYVDLWYQPGLDRAGLDRLRVLYDAHPKDILVLPHPSLAQPVAATAWHHRLLCNTVDTAALTAFVTTYRNQGPEKVPHT